MNINKPTLSIVTTVYNRETLLQRCFDSLLCQTCMDFEWVVIDDGSTDNSFSVINSFRAPFAIKKLSKENGGKHTALNASHELIDGKYVLILDSDDYLIPSAVEEVINGWKKYESNDEIGIVILLKGESTDKPTCMAYEADEGQPVDIMRYQRKTFHGMDACEVIRTELFMKYPVPVFEGEKFISEGALWNRVSFTHKCVYINKVVYIAEYQEDGLTKSGKPLRVHNPNGGMFTANLNMNKKNFFKRRVKNGFLYTCYGFFAKKSIGDMLKTCDSKLLMCMCLPMGLALFVIWKKKYY